MLIVCILKHDTGHILNYDSMVYILKHNIVRSIIFSIVKHVVLMFCVYKSTIKGFKY